MNSIATIATIKRFSDSSNLVKGLRIFDALLTIGLLIQVWRLYDASQEQIKHSKDSLGWKSAKSKKIGIVKWITVIGFISFLVHFGPDIVYYKYL